MGRTELIRSIAEEVARSYLLKLSCSNCNIPVGVSNRHIHLSKEHTYVLFGDGYEVNKIKELSQKGQYAAKETVTVVGPKGIIEGVRILGPERKQTQVEILMSDTFKLGLCAAVRLSGDLKGTPGVVVVGPKGIIKLDCGVIVAKRHIHINFEEARRLNLKHDETVSVITGGDRSIQFNDVVVRVEDSFSAELHLDMDEANAAGIKTGDLIKINKF